MNRTRLYFKNSEILINAYRNEKLFHGSWGGCGAGHLIAAHMGYTVSPHFLRKGSFISYWKKNGKYVKPFLYGHFLEATTVNGKINFIRKWGWRTYLLQLKHIRATGYSVKELKLLIGVFDSHLRSRDDSVYVLNALKAVLLVLKKIHGVTIRDLKANYSDHFAKEKEITEKLPSKYKWVLAAEEDRYITYESFHNPVLKQQYHFPTKKAAPIRECEEMLV